MSESTGSELAGKTALVTGSSRGIGRAIALELARGGARVIVHARSADSGAAACAEAIRMAGGESEMILADLSDPEAFEPFVQSAWSVCGQLDAWINNAGADVLTGHAATLLFEEKLAQLWAVDVRATIGLSRLAGRRMWAQGNGSIVNMGWDQADQGMAGDSGEVFAAVKGAVAAFTRSLALSLAPRVRVNCVAPGWIRTAWGEHAPPHWQERAVRESQSGRWGTPEDVARVVRFLVSPAADFVHGQVLVVNGGFHFGALPSRAKAVGDGP